MTTQPMPIPDGSVVITPNQQYAELQALRKSVDHLAATVDPAMADIRKDVGEIRADITTLRTDTDANTKWRYMITGALLLLTTLVGWGVLNLAALRGG